QLDNKCSVLSWSIRLKELKKIPIIPQRTWRSIRCSLAKIGVRPSGSVILLVQHRRVGELPLQRFAVLEAAAQKLRPGGNRDRRIDPLGQETPELRMMPAQIVPARVAMLANALSQAPDLRDQFLAVHALEVVVESGHGLSSGIFCPMVDAPYCPGQFDI